MSTETQHPSEHAEDSSAGAHPLEGEASQSAFGSDAAINQVQADLERFRDLALRSQADFENYRKRANREKDDAVRYANFSLVKNSSPFWTVLSWASRRPAPATAPLRLFPAWKW